MKNQLTKKLIQNSLKELSKAKPLAKITVKDIIDKANINRSTFYYYFVDKDDLIAAIFRSDVNDAFVFGVEKDWLHNTTHLLQIIYRDADFYRQALQIDSVNNFRSCLYTCTYEACQKIFAAYEPAKRLVQGELDFITRFLSHATTEVYIDYILSKQKQPPEQIADYFQIMGETCGFHSVDSFLKK